MKTKSIMIKKFFTFLIMAIVATPLFAVTDKEMEEAKTIAAQLYLRYANDGSGYLDEVKATTMSELESKLKAKEKENIVAFKQVKVPSDYASWDKARLAEFWGVTFFASPNLTAKGKVARSRVKKRIEAMKISDKPAPVAVEEKKPEAEKPAAAEPAATAAETQPATLAEQEQILEKQEEILADQNAIANDEQERRPAKKSSSTWVYVVILIILIGVVVWLVVFAANMMKKQAEPLTRAGIGADPKELDKLQSKYNSAKDTMEQYRAAFEEEQKETKRLRNEVRALKEQLAALQSAPRRQQEAPAQPQPAPRRQPEPQPQPQRRPVAAEEQPAPRKTASEFYLGRVNNRGLFVRADRQFSPGHSIYRLETRDGLVGTFHVVDRPEVVDMVAEHPIEYLGGGCTAIDLEDTAALSNIVTENAGTAVFEGGAWKVLRRSRIRYE